MTFSVINSYSPRNIGDQAIVRSTLDLLHYSDPASEIVIRTRYHAQSRLYAESGVRVRPAPVNFPPRESGLSGARRLYRALRSLIKPSRSSLQEMSNSVAVICGGGYLYSADRVASLSLPYYVLNTLRAAKFCRDLVWMPVSIGPLNNAKDRALASKLLSAVPGCVVREAKSLAIAKNLQPSADVVLLPDIAFLYPYVRDNPDKPDIGDRLVLISVMDWSWANPSAGGMEGYLTSVRRLIRSLVSDGYRVRIVGSSLIPEQDQDDYAFAMRHLGSLLSRLGSRAGLWQLDSPDSYLSAASQACLVVSTRLHLSILSLVAGTPSIHLSYQPKGEGTYGLMGLSDLCIDVDVVDPEGLTTLATSVLSTRSELSDRIVDSVDAARSRLRAHYLPRLASKSRA